MMSQYQDITTAPKDGSIIRIRGIRFNDPRRYYADAMWDTRECPAKFSGWFPPNLDGEGPYTFVDGWKLSKRSHES